RGVSPTFARGCRPRGGRRDSVRVGGPPELKATMSPQQTEEASQSKSQYDNNGQYTRKGILRYEKIFGDGYVSTGGPETTQYLCSKLVDALRPGVKVLDVGSGIGGAMFDLARQYGASVTGIDLAPEMVAIARERAAKEGALDATFVLGDIME